MSKQQFSVDLAQTNDLEAGRLLLEENLAARLSDQDKVDGFISISFTLEQLAKMAANGITVVAKSGGKVVGILSSQTARYNEEHVPLAASMLESVRSHQLEGAPIDFDGALVCGPICIAREFRGQGVMDALYHGLASQANGKYTTGLTFVSKGNPRSLKAHEKVGMKMLASFQSNGREFDVLGRLFGGTTG